MDEENPLLKDHFFHLAPAQPKSTEPEVLPLDIRLKGINKPLPPGPTLRETALDVAKSVLSEGAKGAAATVVGGPGSVETFIAKDIPEALRSGALWTAKKLDIISPKEQEEYGRKPLPWVGDQTKMQKKGYSSPILHLPTYKGVEKTFKQTMKAAGAPEALTYEPQTTPGKIVGKGAEFAAQGLPGALRTLPGRLITGGGAGVGSELLALSSEDKGSEEISRLTGALAGGIGSGLAASAVGRLFGGLRGMVVPKGVSNRRIAAALAEDIRRGQTNMTMDQLQEAMRTGAPLSIADMAGPQTRKLLGSMAERTPVASEAATSFNQQLQQRVKESGERLKGNIDNIFGGPIDAARAQELAQQSGKIIRDQVYSITRSNPLAQSMPQNKFSSLLSRPIVQQAMKRAEETAKNNPSFNIRVPSVTPGKAAVPPQTTGTTSGVVTTPGQKAVPPRVTNGNLSYWHQVQRELRDIGEVAKGQRDNTLASSAQNARDQILKTLDTVPGYRNARGVAFETFNAADAPEAGYKFFGNMNSFKRKEIADAFRTMTPEQRELFATGFAQRLSETAAKGESGINSLAKSFNNPDFRSRALMVLGPQRYSAIQGQVLSEQLLSKVKQLQFIAEKGGMKEFAEKLAPPAIVGAVGGAAMEAAFLGGQFSVELAIKAAIGAGIGSAGKIALDATERRIANKLLPLATSTDPRDIQRLGDLARQNSAVGRLFNKMSTILSNTVTAYGQGTPTTERPGRATGGSVKGAVNLRALANAARKQVTQSTEEFLKESDDQVAKALDIANQHI